MSIRLQLPITEVLQWIEDTLTEEERGTIVLLDEVYEPDVDFCIYMLKRFFKEREQ